LLSPDETQAAIIQPPLFEPDKVPHSVFLYDLESGECLKEARVVCDRLLFSQDGKLLAFQKTSDCYVLRELESNEIRRRLLNAIGGFSFENIHGKHAVYRKDRHARIHDWQTDELLATHDLTGDDMEIRDLSDDGQVIRAFTWPMR